MDMKQLIKPEDNSSLWPVLYNYNYMSGCPDPLELSLNTQMQVPNDVKDGSTSLHLQLETNPTVEANSVLLHPVEAGLPWHTSFHVLRQSKHWRLAVAMTNRLLELFATDETAIVALRQHTKSYADVAKAEIGRVHDSWSRFNAYMWPAADDKRLELISATTVFVFIFDDIWEMNENENIRIIQAEFISRLKVADPNRIHAATPLQALINEIMQGFHDEDLKAGNGGKEVIERLVEFCNHRPPRREFTTLRDFLDYRIGDAATPFVFACVKFSLGSNVDIASPRIAHFMSLAADHVCYANDLGSFDKEKEAYVNGDVLYLINTVDMVRKVCNLPDDKSAKSAALALQLRIEMQLVDELSRLRASVNVTSEELEFVEAVVYALVGNIFSSVVMSRYGGEVARVSM